MKRGLVFASALAAALAMPLAADARPHGGGHHGGGHHIGKHHNGGKHFRPGGRHHGGNIYYGGRRHHGHHGRRFWHGRWYAYGIGPCWRWSPRYAEFVWVCY
ncbi:MAG: sulfur globule protein precursor [Proteobacteria bacterium]|nr:sulfur globule protein precursor [Pseudomonadota bacterium]